jgi:hypothetical protein
MDRRGSPRDGDLVSPLVRLELHFRERATSDRRSARRMPRRPARKASSGVSTLSDRQPLVSSIVSTLSDRQPLVSSTVSTLSDRQPLVSSTVSTLSDRQRCRRRQCRRSRIANRWRCRRCRRSRIANLGVVESVDAPRSPTVGVVDSVDALGSPTLASSRASTLPGRQPLALPGGRRSPRTAGRRAPNAGVVGRLDALGSPTWLRAFQATAAAARRPHATRVEAARVWFAPRGWTPHVGSLRPVQSDTNSCVRSASASRIVMDTTTTARVVERPTPSVPPRVLMPKWQPRIAMRKPKTGVLERPLT